MNKELEYLDEDDLSQEEQQPLNEEKHDLIKDLVDGLQHRIEQEKSKVLLIIDRIEESVAVCENRETEEIINIDISELPEGVREGDAIRCDNNKYEIDEQTRKEIEERIKNKIKNIFEEN